MILDALGGLVQGAGFGGGPRGAEGGLTGQRRFKDLHAGMTVRVLPGNGLLLDEFVGAVVLFDPGAVGEGRDIGRAVITIELGSVRDKPPAEL